MTIKVYVSGICGSMEVRKQQQRVLFILQGLPIELEVIDITEPGREEERNFMQEECKKHDKKEPLPPQIFNENEYCGDYTDFQLANDDDIVMRFLKLEDESAVSETKDEAASITQNGLGSHNDAEDKEIKEESKDEAAQEAGEKITKSNEGIGVVDKSSTNEIAETVSSKNATKEEEEEEESSEEESSEEEESEEEN